MKKDNSSSCRIVFVGSVVPDEGRFRTAAFSRAGNSAQLGLLDGFAVANMYVRVVSFQPMPIFPRSRQLYTHRQTLQLIGHDTVLVGYMNLPIIKYFSLAWSIYWDLRRAMGKQMGIIISYNFNLFLALPIILASRTGSLVVPILFDIDIPGQTVSSNWKRRADFQLTRHLLRKIHAVIAITSQVVHELTPKLPSLVVEGGLSKQQIENYMPLPIKDNATFNIIFAGALEFYNGVDVIMEAFAGCPSDQIRLHVAGRGSLEGEVQRRSQSDTRIIFHGYLDHNGMALLYKEASLLINHRSDMRIDSRYVFPSKLIEYMATGIPVISTSFRSLPIEYLPFLNILDNESAQTLKECIMEIMRSPDLYQEKARLAREFVLKNKTWRQQSGKILDFLEKIS